MDGKRLSVTVSRAAIRHLALAAGFGGLTLLGTGATVTAAAPVASQAFRLAPMHLVGVTSGHGGGGATSATSSVCWKSSNWSGYALSTSAPSGLPCVPGSGATYTSVTASWTVPTVTSGSRGSSYSAVWTGIDGFTNSNLIQAGTEQDVLSGTPHYDAWWEILPAAETVIPSVPVGPGDSITVNIHQVSGSTWFISLSDISTGKSFTTTQTYTGAGTSAEWIVEAPTVGGRQATLANYKSATFDLGTANGRSPGLISGSAGEIVQGSGFRTQVVSVPSSPDSDSDGFACAYGAAQPPAPITS